VIFILISVYYTQLWYGWFSPELKLFEHT